MEQETNPQKTRNRKAKWGIPVVIVLILTVIRRFLGMEISGNILFFGFYVMMVYNILYYRKTIKRPMLSLLLVQPFGVLGVVLLFPPHLFELLMTPMFFFVIGSGFVMMTFFYLLQERDKRKRCNKLTIATVIDSGKKRTTDQRRQSHDGTLVAYSYSPVVQYYAESELQKATYGDGFPRPIPIGTEVEILYNSKAPEEFCFADEKQVHMLTILAVVLFLLGLSGVFVSVVILIKRLSIF